MKLSGLHLLLTYQCTFECDHCFVWGSPWQTGTLTLEQILTNRNRLSEDILGDVKGLAAGYGVQILRADTPHRHSG